MEIKFDKLYNKPIDIVTVDGFMPQMEIDKIEQNIFNISDEAGTIGAPENQKTTDWRVSKIKWLPFDEIFSSIYQNVGQSIQNYNSDVWRFDLGSITNYFQYTEYHGDEEGKYNWHVDIGSNFNSHRKLSISIQLSHPDEYEGGDLQIFDPTVLFNDDDGFPTRTINKGIGDMVIFPSYMPHRVTPVTKGVRKSLVLWVGSKPFK